MQHTIIVCSLIVMFTFSIPLARAFGEIESLWAHEYKTPISSLKDIGISVINRKHDDILGGKGRDIYKFRNQPLSRCQQGGKTFDHARIVFRQKRFADAKLVQKPRPDCHGCTSLVVEWFNEPTGKLDYQLQIYWRKSDSSCLSIND